MDRWAAKVALVTGASSGIGREIARLLIENGMKVVGCGRKEGPLEELRQAVGSKGELMTVKCDVSKESDVQSMFSQINEKYGGVDVCINNAALLLNAPLLTGSTADWQSMVDVNIVGLLNVSREAVKSMKANKCQEGHIINLNSISGHRVINYPPGHVYSATKHAVTAISNGLRYELLDVGFLCRVSQISPGMVSTPMITPERVPDHKILDPVDIAEAVIYQLGVPAHAQVQDVILRPRLQPY